MYNKMMHIRHHNPHPPPPLLLPCGDLLSQLRECWQSWEGVRRGRGGREVGEEAEKKSKVAGVYYCLGSGMMHCVCVCVCVRACTCMRTHSKRHPDSNYAHYYTT